MSDERVLIVLCLGVIALATAYLLRYTIKESKYAVCTYPHATEDELHERYRKLFNQQRDQFKADVAEAVREAMEAK